MAQVYTMKQKIVNLEGKYMTNSILSTVDIRFSATLSYYL